MSSVQPSTLLFLLLLCISMHACNSRQLDKHSVKKVHVHAKASEKKIPGSASEVKSSISKEITVLKTHEAGGATHEVNQEEARDAKAAVTKQVIYHQEMKKRTNPRASFRVPHTKQAIGAAGSRVLMSFNEDLQHSSNIIEGLKRRARSILGSNSEDTEESVGSKEYGTVQDVMVMDYSAPHRKSPIHNLSP